MMQPRDLIKMKIEEIVEVYSTQLDLAEECLHIVGGFDYAVNRGKYFDAVIKHHDLLEEFNKTTILDAEKSYFDERMSQVKRQRGDKNE